VTEREAKEQRKKDREAEKAEKKKAKKACCQYCDEWFWCEDARLQVYWECLSSDCVKQLVIVE
jgi:hypothetical protein